MAKVEATSKVVRINQNIEDIYNFFSDFKRIESLVNIIRQMGGVDGMASSAGISQEDLGKMKDTLQGVRFTDDVCYLQLKGMGEIALQILDREHPKLVKYGGVVPFEYFIWIQFIQDAPYETRMRITFKGEMNFIYKMALKGKLESGMNSLAEGLTKIPFSMIK